MQPQTNNGKWKCDKSDNSKTKPDTETRFVALDSEGIEPYRIIFFKAILKPEVVLYLKILINI